ncbi:thioredoxin family protein [Anaerobacillus sp. CMMVII]|uniref:thioredoxin family protein n=1 Tax=Anaerobacillus sp. CMMVII TaxID=2755588 RepID=UPI0021B7DE16|nr:thioredoxin family protein [Anaerobacillus sp. CMMVII]MCT8136912.1 thioredoxin family protein [Anaerobacillus sp. CMMVII]
MEQLTCETQLKEKINHEEIVIILIKTQNCSVCEAVYAQLEEFLTEYPVVKGYYVSIEEIPQVASEYLVFTGPTVLLFINGKEIERQSRFVSYQKFRDQIQRYL